jgi:hypothetical protein
MLMVAPIGGSVCRPAGAGFVGSPRSRSDGWQVNFRDMAAPEHKNETDEARLIFGQRRYG